MAIKRWHLLRVGACRHPEMMARKGGHICPVDFPALVGLILHDDFGPILFDTGYHRRFFTATEAFPERLYRMMTPVQYSDTDSLELQLERFGLVPSDIAGVFISHFHGDHVAGLKLFPKARIFCARDGLDRTRQGGRFTRVRQGLLSALVPDDIDARATFVEDMAQSFVDLGPFTSGIDLIGDGSLFAIQLAGHCPGHWGLLVRPQTGPYAFFIGDAAWSLSAIRDNVPPPALTTALLGNTAIYRATLLTLNQLSKTRPQVEIIPSHCEITAAKWLGHD
jgi:glyoxylase-like metal-dependent hydrolase (beta-lactamase superfamily II)